MTNKEKARERREKRMQEISLLRTIPYSDHHRYASNLIFFNCSAALFPKIIVICSARISISQHSVSFDVFLFKFYLLTSISRCSYNVFNYVKLFDEFRFSIWG